MKTIINILEITRIAIAALAFYFGYQIGFANGYDPVAQLHFMTPLVVGAIAGLSGIEGLLFGKASAISKGFETGSNYQRQSDIALLSYGVIAVVVYFLNWGIKADLTILFTFMFFIFFSSINHATDAIRNKNYKWQNLNRPFLTLFLIAGLIYPVIMALKTL
jgi:hypothetical protein